MQIFIASHFFNLCTDKFMLASIETFVLKASLSFSHFIMQRYTKGAMLTAHKKHI